MLQLKGIVFNAPVVAINMSHVPLTNNMQVKPDNHVYWFHAAGILVALQSQQA